MARLADAVAAALAEVLGRRPRIGALRPVGGGSINEAYLADAEGLACFVKVNRATRRAFFEAEADGLRAIAATCTLRVPRVIAIGTGAGKAFLILEALPLGGPPDHPALARALAGLHSMQRDGFGWPRDNFIGASPQANAMDDDWPRFYATRRLAPQFARLRAAGEPAVAEAGERLSARLGEFFAAYRPRPSLLHGDLWSGNAGFLGDGTPVVFDPAVYHGDREADIAMTELFGGFPARFRAAYEAVFPLDAGYAVRRDLYNLYHVVNHANLFGGGYARQARQMIGRLAAELG